MPTEPHAAHPALAVPLSERVDYLTVIASMAGADVVLDQSELEKLQELCRALEIPEEQAEKIVETARRPTHTIARHIESLRSSDLRLSLLTDCLAIAYADGEYAKGEKEEIMALAAQLGVTGEQVAALEETFRSLHAAEIQEQSRQHHGAAAIANRLAGVGIPLGLAGGVSAFGLASTGIASGATAVAMGLGLATGFGAALGAGVGTIMGIRWLHDKLKSG